MSCGMRGKDKKVCLWISLLFLFAIVAVAETGTCEISWVNWLGIVGVFWCGWKVVRLER